VTTKRARQPRLEVLHTAMTPRCSEDGKPKLFTPYQPHLAACELCPARCCRLQVEASLPDAVEICSTLGLPFFAALTIAPSDGAHSFPVEGDPRFVAPGDGWPGRGEIVLGRKPDGACGFLVEHQGYWRCSAYGLRPSACRLYPFGWRRGQEEGGPFALLCPVPYAVTPAVERRFVEDFERGQHRWKIHDRLIAEWSQRTGGRTAGDFLAFALPRAAEAIGVALGPALEGGSADERLAAAIAASKGAGR
jgi:Fe-S-cluster containining protein